jgi:hypothetical protein
MVMRRRVQTVSAVMSGALELCAALIERQANLGDPLAGFVVGQLHEATTAMKCDNVAGVTR